MRFVVTGAGGFLGRNVVRELLAHTEHDVVAVSSQSVEALQAQFQTPQNTGLQLERLRHEPTSNILERGHGLVCGDVLINCAFPWNRGGFAMANGLSYSYRLLRVARDAEIHRFVNVSSQSVYSQRRTAPADEESEVECDTPYSTAKYALELATSYTLEAGTFLNARMSSLIGPEYNIRIVNRFIQQILAGEPIVIDGGTQVFDFMDVQDASRALIRLGEAELVAHDGVVNVGASNPLALKVIAETVASVSEHEMGWPVNVFIRESTGDERHLTMDCTRLHQAYGFTPEVSFEESIRRIFRNLETRSVDA